MSPDLSQEELKSHSDDTLNALIAAKIEEGFDARFALPGMNPNPQDGFKKFLIGIAEAAFAEGYKSGYVSATLDMTEILRHSLASAA